MPCVYFNDNYCNFSKHRETKGVLYRHICGSCFAQDGKVSTHSASEYKTICKKRLTLAQLQPDHVQEDFLNSSKSDPTVVYSASANIVNNQYSSQLLELLGRNV